MKSRENEKENREIRWQGPFSRPLLWWSGALDSGPQRCSLWTGRGGPGTWRHCPQRVNVALRGDHDGHEHGPLRGRDAVHGGGDVQGPRHVHVRHVPGRDVPGQVSGQNPTGQNPIGQYPSGQKPRRTKTQGDKIQWGQKPRGTISK